tara:strand:- start:1436 stop:2278 length:843 start_codon:yes stop_codon:yes gene_type:complete
MNNPYLLDLPAVVSFSGGRTSGFLLRKTLDAYGGSCPDGMVVSFQNTGLEHPATLEFVHAVEVQWGVPIVWLEYRVDEDGEPCHAVVDYDSASRDGEPFTALNEKNQYLPNPVARVCTVQLKIRTLARYLATVPGFDDGYTNAVGLRYDEPRRALRLKGDRVNIDAVAPMFHAKHTEDDVLEFWRGQPFDLELPLNGNLAGNCTGCFLKSAGKIEMLMEEMPEHFEWWINAEKSMTSTHGKGGVFRKDRPTYAAMLNTVKTQGRLFDGLGDDTIPCMCTD